MPSLGLSAYTVALRVVGFFAGAFAVLQFTVDHARRLAGVTVFNPGLNLATGDLVLVAIIALVIAECLKRIEKRFAALEQRKTSTGA